LSLRTRRWTGAFLAVTGLGFLLAVLTLGVYLLNASSEAIPTMILASAGLVLVGLGGFYITKAIEAQKTQLAAMEPRHLIGLRGVAKSHLRPGEVGIVWVSGDYWTAEALEEIQEGQEVVVKAVDGLRLRVSTHQNSSHRKLLLG
jgi:membrane-bound ClpP family serine protease